MKIKVGAVNDKDRDLGESSVGIQIQALVAARNTHGNADYHFPKHGSRSNTSIFYKNNQTYPLHITRGAYRLFDSPRTTPVHHHTYTCIVAHANHERVTAHNLLLRLITNQPKPHPGPSRRVHTLLCRSPATSRRRDALAAAAAEVADGLELVGRGVGGEPLLDGEELLRAPLVRARDGDLDVVAVPAVVRAGAVGGQPHSARRLRHAGPAAAEDVQVAALEVGVALPHEPAPRRAGPRSPRRCRPRRPAAA